jgi:hypothetical protein
VSADPLRYPSLARVRELDWETLSYEDRRKVGRWYRGNYLRSKWWRELRARALAECDRRCQRCGAKGTGRYGRDGQPANPLHVHHLSYANLGREQLGVDVEVVCAACHRAEHGVGS